MHVKNLHFNNQLIYIQSQFIFIYKLYMTCMLLSKYLWRHDVLLFICMISYIYLRENYNSVIVQKLFTRKQNTFTIHIKNSHSNNQLLYTQSYSLKSLINYVRYACNLSKEIRRHYVFLFIFMVYINLNKNYNCVIVQKLFMQSLERHNVFICQNTVIMHIKNLHSNNQLIYIQYEFIFLYKLYKKCMLCQNIYGGTMYCFLFA